MKGDFTMYILRTWKKDYNGWLSGFDEFNTMEELTEFLKHIEKFATHENRQYEIYNTNCEYEIIRGSINERRTRQ